MDVNDLIVLNWRSRKVMKGMMRAFFVMVVMLEAILIFLALPLTTEWDESKIILAKLSTRGTQNRVLA